MALNNKALDPAGNLSAPNSLHLSNILSRSVVHSKVYGLQVSTLNSAVKKR
jgi:hypothetical protein